MMFYKGGPKNYSKGDWQVMAGMSVRRVCRARHNFCRHFAARKKID